MSSKKRGGKASAAAKSGGRKRAAGKGKQKKIAAESGRRKKSTVRRIASAAAAAATPPLPGIMAAASGVLILAWEDDPKSGRDPRQTGAPSLPAGTLGITIDSPAPAVDIYPLGTNEFRYWVAAESLTRGLEFWTPLLPAGTKWATPDNKLQAKLDIGVDLNAYYRRRLSQLEFYHFTVGGKTIFSGESPNILCHELGHAILDAIRPQLFNAASIEGAAFHESFGDISALLCSLQIQAVRDAVINETGGRLYRTTFVSRLAEEMGEAIRQVRPDAVEPDCLRNAVNSFFYLDPAGLPPKAPANLLSSAAHSFGRIFTGAFFEAFAGMLVTHAASPTPADVETVTRDAGRIIIEAVRNAPVVPNYFSQVAAHMVAVDELSFGRKYREALKGGFVRHGILSLEAASTLTSPPPPASEILGMTESLSSAHLDERSNRTLPQKAIPCKELGLAASTIVVEAPGEQERYQVAASDTDVGSLAPPTDTNASKSFLEDLFRLGRVDVGDHGDPDTQISHPTTKKTHLLKKENGNIFLVREIFDCGFFD